MPAFSLRHVPLHRPDADAQVEPATSGPTAHFHLDARAADLARAAEARAITIGSDIYFGRGEFQPGTPRGRELIAHELVHAAQAANGTSSSDAAGAEREATQIARTVTSGNTSVPPVRHAAAPIMFDRIPEPNLGQDKDTIIGELRLRYPYLDRLSNKKEVLDTFADFIRFKRREMELLKKLDPLPRITQGATAAIERRERQRRPFERALDKNARKLGKVSTSVLIDPLEILSPDFYSAESRAGLAGAKAVANEMRKHKAWLTVARGGYDAFGFGLTGYISGVWLPIKADGIHLNFFKEQSYLTTVMADIEIAFLNALTDVQEEELASFVDQAPYVAEHALDQMLEEMRESRRARNEPTEEEQMVLEMRAEKQAYATQIKERTQAAVAPLILLASFFAFEGPLDLLLTVAPVHKLGKAFTLGKVLIGKRRAKALEKAGQELLEHLDDEAKLFLKTASRLGKSEVKALKTIFKHTNSEAVIRTLMHRHLEGTADVAWIAKKLEKKKISGKFVDEFTRYPANPQWKTLEDIVEKRKVDPGVRDAFAAHMKGFLAEETASYWVRSQSLLGKLFRGRKGAKLTRVERNIEYGANRSFDLFAQSDKAELLFGEVKHWSATTWASPGNRADVLAQLVEHNAGIDIVRKRLLRRASDVTDRVLYVSSKGFQSLPKDVRDQFAKDVERLRWRIEELPDNAIADFKSLIDRVR